MKATTKPTIIIILVILLLGYFLWPNNDQSVISNLPPRENGSGEAIQIIAFGDSLTAGYGLSLNESYPAQLEVALLQKNYDVKVINSGVSGETTRGNLERAKFIREQDPDIVLLGIGGNDALRRLPIEETEKNLSETINILKSGNNPPVVILLGMQAPINMGLGYKQAFDSLYEDMAATLNILLVPFITAEVFLKNGNRLPDGIHLNAQGYKEVIDLYLLPTLDDVLTQINS